jgi:hypothetical protein
MPTKDPASKPATRDDETINDADFQAVLKELLSAYQPLLEEDLRRAKAPDQLIEEEQASEPSCEDEIALASRLFERFSQPEVAVRILPLEARQLIEPIQQDQWCLRHIRCCYIFGWLVCRRQRTFRAFAYYVYRYWLCVRELLGRSPAGRPLTAEEREDVQTLVKSLATAYRPYLNDQLASVEFPLGLPDEVIGGQVDCNEGETDAAAVFDRLLNPETAAALLGRDVFAASQKEPWFWFCRCWCLCAIRFGCCLARAKNLIDVLRCLRASRRCLRDCFEPLRCELTAPTGCTEEEFSQQAGGLAVTVKGTAAGASFSHYELQIRKVEGAPCDDDSGWSDPKDAGVVVYPGGTVTGTTPVVNGVLGQLNTTVLAAGSYEVRVCVYSVQPSAVRHCCCIQFNLFKKLVYISHVAGAPAKTPPGPFVSNAPIVSGNPGGVVVPVGCCVTVRGSAWVGECNNRKIKCFDLRYGIGFLPGPNDVGFNPGAYVGSLLTSPVCYTPPDEAGKRAPWNQVISGALTTQLVLTDIDLGNGNVIKVWKLRDYCFDSGSLLPPCPDPAHACRSGKYTLLLDVEDTLGQHTYDTQRVWFDNKPIHVEFAGLEGLASCQDMSILKFVPPGAPCGVAWPLNLLGIVYDEYIDPADLSYPSDNFDFYTLEITRQGGPTYSVPITPDLITLGPDPYKGTKRVGDPGSRCEQAIGGCPPPPFPPKFVNTLTKLDLRIFDDVCAASLVAPFAPLAGFALKRGACCGYTFQLYAQDKTWSGDGSVGVCHRAWSLPWAVCICNDVDQRQD